MDYWRGIYSIKITAEDIRKVADNDFSSRTSAVLHGPFSGDDIARIKAGIA